MTIPTKSEDVGAVLEAYYNKRDKAYQVPCPHNGKCNKIGCPDKKTWEKERQQNIANATNEATAQILQLIESELQYILDNASGGGNWPRVIIQRLAQLKGKANQ